MINFINNTLINWKLITLRRYVPPIKKIQNIDINQRYSNLPVRVKMGKIYTDSELQKYKEKSLKRRMP